MRGPGGPRAGPPPSTELLLQCQLDRRQAMSGDQVCENSFSATSRVKNIWNLEIVGCETKNLCEIKQNDSEGWCGVDVNRASGRSR